MVTEQQKRIVFISYSHEDTAFVNLFAGLLLHFDIQFWKDSKDISVGGPILKSIYDGIKNTSHFCCIISSASVKSPWVEEELTYAKHRNIEDPSLSLVPILIDPVDIPDYIKTHKVAHLENRDLSLDNPETIMILRAFGVEFREKTRIITGPKRRIFLKRCRQLRLNFTEFRDWLDTFEKRYEEYKRLSLVRPQIMVRNPVRRGFGEASSMLGPQSIPNPAYNKWAIDRAHNGAANALMNLRQSALKQLKLIGMVRRAGEAAGVEMTGGLGGRLLPSDVNLWGSLVDALDLARYVSETIYGKRVSIEDEPDEPIDNIEAARDEDELEDGDDTGEEEDSEAQENLKSLSGVWWVSEKLPRWNATLPRVEAALEGVIGILANWGNFDSDNWRA